jgi:Na+-transporting methylmalonyl-CoA/oxaloacetate decarboxylase gamma subunit
MIDWYFGLIMMVMGMGVTLLSLYLLTLVIQLLVRLFPVKPEENIKKQRGPAATGN